MTLTHNTDETTPTYHDPTTAEIFAAGIAGAIILCSFWHVVRWIFILLERYTQ